MTGSNNTATGATTLLNNTTGFNNTATGYQALGGNTTGSFNIALGVSAGGNLTTGKNNIDIGNAGVAGESNKNPDRHDRHTEGYLYRWHQRSDGA